MAEGKKDLCRLYAVGGVVGVVGALENVFQQRWESPKVKRENVLRAPIAPTVRDPLRLTRACRRPHSQGETDTRPDRSGSRGQNTPGTKSTEGAPKSRRKDQRIVVVKHIRYQGTPLGISRLENECAGQRKERKRIYDHQHHKPTRPKP